MDSKSSEISVELGSADEIESVPETVDIEGKRFFIGRSDGEYVLLSSLCPHRGGPVLSTGEHLECPMHDWKFDGSTGAALECESDGLQAFEIESDDGILRVRLPRQALEEAHPSRRHPPEEPQDGDLAIEPSACVGEILDVLGEPAVDVFYSYGFACLGCALADEESIRRAARRHHLTNDEMWDLVEQLRSIHRDPGSAPTHEN